MAANTDKWGTPCEYLGIVVNVITVLLHSLPITSSLEGWLAQRCSLFWASETEEISKILSL